MAIFTSPRSLQYVNFNTNASPHPLPHALVMQSKLGVSNGVTVQSHMSFLHLILLVFEAVLQVVCVSLPGYIAAQRGMFDADAQKMVANLNILVFTPCLIFVKLGSQLTAEKLSDLAIIPALFVVQTLVSYGCATGVAKCFGFKKRPANFLKAMAVFGNSNSLPISLVMSLSQTLKGLHWRQIPNDNDDEVAARGILYLLIFQQLGQLVRWSWGYHVLLAPRERYLEQAEEEEDATGMPGTGIEHGQVRYSDNPDQTDPDEPLLRTRSSDDLDDQGSDEQTDSEFQSGGQTPVTSYTYAYTKDTADEGIGGPPRGPFLPRQSTEGDLLCFPNVEEVRRESQSKRGGPIRRLKNGARRFGQRTATFWEKNTAAVYQRLPKCMQTALSALGRFLRGVWSFMNPPLWAMLASIVVASVRPLQKVLFIDEGFVRNSITRAVNQNAQVAVPLILVVLGANLARNTIPEDAKEDHDHPKEERNLIIASLIARMVLPTIVIAPIIALVAKYVPVSILGDPIFIIVCFLITGAPSALQLAQICQLNNVYVGAMSKLLFQSYVIWILPSTLILVTLALEVLEWSSASSR